MVTMAAAALLLAAAALVASTAPNFFADRVLDVYREAYAGTAAEEAVRNQSTTSFQVVGIAIVVAAVVLAGLAVLIRRRSRAARIGVWTLGGLLICAAGPGLVLEPSPPPRPRDALPASEIERMLDEAVPAWATAAGWSGLVIAVVALLAAVVLLGLPRANDYFRKPPPLAAAPPSLHGG